MVGVEGGGRGGGTGTPAMSRDAASRLEGVREGWAGAPSWRVVRGTPASRLIPYANPHVPQMAKAPIQSHQEESSVYSACGESGRMGWRERVRGQQRGDGWREGGETAMAMAREHQRNSDCDRVDGQELEAVADDAREHLRHSRRRRRRRWRRRMIGGACGEGGGGVVVMVVVVVFVVLMVMAVGVMSAVEVVLVVVAVVVVEVAVVAVVAVVVIVMVAMMALVWLWLW